ncbi:MAG TPA: FAD binding domain-containing protein [Tepidisphaeraceae bacterium]|nr:FAD binding domain-containing protein [Tepidisphaeraceae bacterium]
MSDAVPSSQLKDHLTIFVNGKRHMVRGLDAFRPLTDWLRYDLHLTGTKVVCAEGDCGSCTVMIGRGVDGRIAYAPVCGCIQYLLQLDGAHVVTIEGLKYAGGLNPVQQAFVECHGAQCGFCTPGFVVAVHSLLEPSSEAIDACAVKRSLTGNLCRCTGYEPILNAVEGVDRAAVQSVDALFPPETILEEMTAAAREGVLIAAGGRSFFKPVTIRQAVEFRAGNPGCAIIAGGTDLGVQMNKGMRTPMSILSTAALPDWQWLDVSNDAITFAGGVTLSVVQDVLREEIAECAEFLEWFGSPQIRNAGTLAGNLANASPIGDMLPPLMVLDAEIILTGATCERAVSINDFYTGYRQTVMRNDELITGVRVPRPAEGDVFRLYKVSKRKDLDISTFSAAVWMQMCGGQIIDCRLAYGGVGPTVVRLRKTEALLRGRPLDDETLDELQETVLSEITPISDVRGSDSYRNLLAVNVLRRLALEMASGDAGSSKPV